MALARRFCSNSAPAPRPSSAPVLFQFRAISAASERDEVSLLGFVLLSLSQWKPRWAQTLGSGASTSFWYNFDIILIPRFPFIYFWTPFLYFSIHFSWSIFFDNFFILWTLWLIFADTISKLCFRHWFSVKLRYVFYTFSICFRHLFQSYPEWVHCGHTAQHFPMRFETRQSRVGH